jgi:hypothetical protein
LSKIPAYPENDIPSLRQSAQKANVSQSIESEIHPAGFAGCCLYYAFHPGLDALIFAIYGVETAADRIRK